MNNNLRKIEKELRAFAKRCKDIKYNVALLFSFLVTGSLSLTANGKDEVETARKGLQTSITDMKKLFKEAKAENNKLMKGSNLELIQLMEQGDHVVKSPWSSWQYGMNYFYSDWRGVYKGRGDKKQKYPYEGIFERSSDLFLRNISPDSDFYETYTSSINEPFSHSATTSTIKRLGGSSGYGLASTIANQEPIASIELGASVKPKNISKIPVTVTPPTITVNAVTPLNTPEPPEAPELPIIEIPKFNPVAPEKITVSLPTPPTFNIKLGSFCNYMTPNCETAPSPSHTTPTNGGKHSGTAYSFDHNQDVTIKADDLTGGPGVRYAWTSYDSALLKVYFDYGLKSLAQTSWVPGGKTATVDANLTIDSIRGGIQPAPSVNGAHNTGMFLTGGSRVATLDNARNATIANNKTINMMGPLVIGYEVQSDEILNRNIGGTSYNNGKRSLVNLESGILTDAIEKSDQTADGRLNSLLKVKQVYSDSTGVHGYNPNSNGTGTAEDTTLTLPTFAGGGTLDITRDPDIGYKDTNGNFVIKKHGGYTGYKVGLILTYEKVDNIANDSYDLINKGTIDFQGRNSIGIQVYAPGNNGNENAPLVTVKNEGANSKITLGGVASYGLKLSSRVNANSTVENEGTIEITGDNTATYKQDNNPATSRTHLYDADGTSLSSGIAILEDGSLSGNASIRAYTGRVLNKGTISVSGGAGNTGMVLINKANDDITNDTNGNINVTGSKNIGMRVDLGTVVTDNAAGGSPKAINNGKITVGNGEQNIGMVANNSETSGIKAIATNNGTIEFTGAAYKAIGLFAQDGAEIVNAATGKITGPTAGGLNETLGMVIQGKVPSKNVPSSGINNGEIDLAGTKVTGVYNQGTFTMENGATGTAKVTTSGVDSISLYAKGNTTTTNINSGKIIGKDGALTLFADHQATVNLGTATSAPELESYGVGSLLFYNYTKSSSGSYTSDGVFKLNNPNVKATLDTGATAFYFKDTTPAAAGVSGSTADKLNAMFAGSGTNRIKLKLTDKDSTLFVLDNTNPNTTPIKISEIGTNAATVLGSFVEIDSASSQNYKAYKATKATLSIDENVNLDNHTGSVISKYYRADFLNSAVTVEAGKKMSGTDATQIKQVIAQANYDGATGTSNIDVVNNGEIEFSKKGGTAIAVDYGQATNNGKITMNAANGVGENSIGLFGASSSKLTNSSTGEIYLGTKGVGIWGANKIDSSVSGWGKNIDITNAGRIEGIAAKEEVFGIYADNDTTAYSTATSTINHSGTINLAQNKKSVGIYMKNGDLTSTGDISVKEGSVGVDATNSNVTVNGGTYTIGKESVGFKLTNVPSTKNFLGNSGNLSITDEGSVAYLLSNSNLESGVNFTDNLTLTSTKAYTYINTAGSTLKYENTKTIANDESIFINAANSNITLKSATDINSTNKKITGVYATRSTVKNEGKITLTGDNSSALYAEGSTVSNESTGKITVGKDGSGIYVKSITTPPAASASGTNYGEITIGEASVGMRAEDAAIINETTGKITSTAEKATGMSQSGGSQDITNKGIITLTGDKSIGLHSEAMTNTNHKVINTGTITVGD